MSDTQMCQSEGRSLLLLPAPLSTLPTFLSIYPMSPSRSIASLLTSPGHETEVDG